MSSAELPPRRGLVALCGKSGVGKTTVARHLEEHYGFQICNTGHTCRAVARLVFGDETKTHLHAVTDALRTIDGSIFLKTALRDIVDRGRIVIDAIRFDTDLDYARQHGFCILRIEAGEIRRKKWLRKRKQEFDFCTDVTHSTETELDNAAVDHVIFNNSSIDVLIGRSIEALAVLPD